MIINNNCEYVYRRKEVCTCNFLQMDVSRSHIGGKDYHYVIWRRFENHFETWLCVVWHRNWDLGRKGSDNVPISEFDPESNQMVNVVSYLREDVERWTLNLLHRAGIFSEDDSVHEDFEQLANDARFARIENFAKNLSRTLFKSLSKNEPETI